MGPPGDVERDRPYHCGPPSDARAPDYDLAQTPGNPTSDHAEKLLDVLDLLNGQRPIAATSVLVALPLLHYTVEHPEQFWYRAATRVASVERPIGQEPLAIFGQNVLHMFLAFNWRGASTWVVIGQWEPFLDAVTASLWVVGVILLVARIARRSVRWTIVALAFFVLTLPSTLSLAFPDENPSINRSGTVIPVVFLVAALPVVELLVRPRRRIAAFLAGSGLAVLFLFSVILNYRDYFVGFRLSYEQSVEHSMAMAHVLDDYRRQGVPLRQMYLLYSDYWVDGRNIAFELGDPSWAPAQVVEAGKLPPDTGASPRLPVRAGQPDLGDAREDLPGGEGADHPPELRRPQLPRLLRSLTGGRVLFPESEEKADLAVGRVGARDDPEPPSLEESD